MATQFAKNTYRTVQAHNLPWSVSQLGARVEYRFASPAPRNGTESAKSADPDLEDFLHVYLANRGILLTPFHNMALMSPSTTKEQVAHHDTIFERAVSELLSARMDPS
jgi:glutamate-1-semialdehyde 2,1-aminomutase